MILGVAFSLVNNASTRYIEIMNNTIVLLERLSALIQQSLREDAARHGLQPIHMQILAYLAQANRYSNIPIAVAEFLGITRGTVSQSLAVLERKGLISKTPDPQHGRRVRLDLTAAGLAVLRAGWSRRLQAALRSVTLSEADLAASLRGLLLALQRQNDQRAFGICHQCAHFLRESGATHCGLTGEPLATDETLRICREWTVPAGASAEAVLS